MAKISRDVAKAHGLLDLDPAILKAHSIEIEPDPDAPTEKLDRFLAWGRKARMSVVRSVSAAVSLFIFVLTWLFANLIVSIGYSRNDIWSSVFAAVAFVVAVLVAIVTYVMVANTLNPPKAE